METSDSAESRTIDPGSSAGRDRAADASRQSTDVSKHRVLRFEPQLRLERRPQDGQQETEQPDHSASLGDSITSSSRTRFSVDTGTQLTPASDGTSSSL